MRVSKSTDACVFFLNGGNFKYYLINDYIRKDTSQSVADEVFDGYGNQYSMLTVTLKLRRKTLFFTFNLVIPSLAIYVATIIGFILPPDSGEKIGLRNEFFLQCFSSNN